MNTRLVCPRDWFWRICFALCCTELAREVPQRRRPHCRCLFCIATGRGNKAEMTALQLA